jgi:hypothetical protein
MRCAPAAQNKPARSVLKNTLLVEGRVDSPLLTDLAAATAHIRARFLTSAFWLNCLGMLVLSVAVLVGSQLLPV